MASSDSKPVEKLSRIHAFVKHVDHCASCCLESWLGGAEIIGWMPTPFKEHVDPIAVVAECPKCFTHWWTHYGNIPIPYEYFPDHVVDLLKEAKAARKA